jgi:dihydroflavonol-4-reductase
MKIPTSSPIVVTGSTGYVGGVLVQQLLEAGLTVHCPVRDPTNESKIRHLKDLEGGDRLKFFEANLLEKGSYLESMKGCSVVFHVASPFVVKVPRGKEQELVLDPAINGTLNVLESAGDPLLDKCVRRVVVTSSVASIAADATDCEEVRRATGKMINEEHWNETSSKDHQPYAYSKTMAEKAAWEYVRNTPNCGFELVVCNPGFVMGPGVKVHESAESYDFVKTMLTLKSGGCPDMGFAIVDVRDVARGHIAAGFLPSETVAGQRYVLVGTNTTFLELSKVLQASYPDQPLPNSLAPKWLLWCIGPWIGFSRRWVSSNIGHTLEHDNSKSLRDLELGKYVPLEKTMTQMFRQCLESGYVPTVGTKS